MGKLSINLGGWDHLDKGDKLHWFLSLEEFFDTMVMANGGVERVLTRFIRALRKKISVGKINIARHRYVWLADRLEEVLSELVTGHYREDFDKQ